MMLIGSLFVIIILECGPNCYKCRNSSLCITCNSGFGITDNSGECSREYLITHLNLSEYQRVLNIVIKYYPVHPVCG